MADSEVGKGKEGGGIDTLVTLTASHVQRSGRRRARNGLGWHGEKGDATTLPPARGEGETKLLRLCTSAGTVGYAEKTREKAKRSEETP